MGDAETETKALEAKLHNLQQSVQDNFSLVHQDLKELRKALVELVRVQGQVEHILGWVGNQQGKIDSIDSRLREAEQSIVANSTGMRVGSRAAHYLVVAASNVVTAVLVFFVVRGG